VILRSLVDLLGLLREVEVTILINQIGSSDLMGLRASDLRRRVG